VVAVSLSTATSMDSGSPVAVPLAVGSPEQSLVVNSSTVEPASAVTLTAGELSLAGDTGVVDVSVGVAGGVESSTYVKRGTEHGVVFCAASEAVARKLVDESSATVTSTENVPSVRLAVSVPAGASEHSASVYSRTTAPGSVVPLIEGVVSFAGDPGLLPVIVSDEGSVESSTYVTGSEQPDALPAASVAVARKAVVLSSLTVTSKEKAPAVAVVASSGTPEQSLVVNNFTVASVSAVPSRTGVVSSAGESGSVPVNSGTDGRTLSST
jgi:hypothetical protein